MYVCLDFLWHKGGGNTEEACLTWLEYILVILKFVGRYCTRSIFVDFRSVIGCGSKMLWSCVQKVEMGAYAVYIFIRSLNINP